MLKNRDIDIPFCVCWANEPWTRAWVGETKVLIPQLYGEKREWKEHFDKQYYSKYPIDPIWKKNFYKSLGKYLNPFSDYGPKHKGGAYHQLLPYQ